MALRNILIHPDPRLKKVATPVASVTDDLRRLADDMLETMYHAPGIGLAAPQVGISQRVFVVDTAWKEADPQPMIFVNPQIVETSPDQATGLEGCLSIPGQSFAVPRPVWIKLVWQDLTGVVHEGQFDGVQAVCICHEFDHLNGVLISQTGVLQ
ncbi:MAG: peptide deformylase [Paracoccaceae bacterium]|nr:peptide deformylase [Paracoccaceae bacterium]